ncbi:MAG: FAD-binding protein [Heliobacteriaceae bacterium]|nr:FAD-binding protein [Heliobacteriaceae bacterium]
MAKRNSSELLIQDLTEILPARNILTSLEDRDIYSRDKSNLPNKAADAVVFVENIEQVQNIVKLARGRGIPVICRGAGTNVVGACTVEGCGGIVMDFSKMNKILEINAENSTVRVQPGVVVGELQKQVEALGLYYPPDPSALAISTIGGSIAQSSAGARTFKYGSTKDYVLGLVVVTADGEILRTGSSTVKNATGYNLGSIFIGSEGTLGIVVEAVLKLIPKPESKKVMLAYFDTVRNAVKAVNTIIEKRILPATIDFMDKNAVNTAEKYSPSGMLCDKEALLVIEIDGCENSLENTRKVTVDVLEKCGACAIRCSGSDEEYEKIWAARRSSMTACAQLRDHVTTDDVIVPRDKLARLVEGIQKICTKYKLISCLIGHIGDGSVHPQIPIDYNDEDEYSRYKLAKKEIYDLTVSLGGLISGEHGIGSLKRDYIHKFVDANALKYMRKIKEVFDPDNILNPNKIFLPE